MKKMSMRILGVLAGALFILAGCSAPAHIEKDDNTDFSRYKNYSWIDSDKGKKRASDLQEQSIRDAVNKELQKQGWREVKNNPDVLLSYDVLVERTNKQTSDPVYSQPYTRLYYNPYLRRWGQIYYPSQFLGYDNRDVSVREGTLTISMVDVRSDKTVWQGWTTEEVSGRRLTSREIQSSVKAIFRKFDVAKR